MIFLYMEKILTITQVADYLRISPRTVKQLIRKEGLPVIRLGVRSTRVNFQQLEKWLEQQSNNKN